MTTTTSVSFDLASGERLLWSGVPRQGIALNASDVFVVPLSLLWGGFAVFWEVTAFQSGAPLFFGLWGVPFVVMGLYITIGRFFYDSLRRRRTFYGLASDRVIVASGVISPHVKSLSLRTLTDVVLEENANGLGTIFLGPQRSRSSRFSAAGAGWPGKPLDTAFEMISDAKRIFELINEAQRALVLPTATVVRPSSSSTRSA